MPLVRKEGVAAPQPTGARPSLLSTEGVAGALCELCDRPPRIRFQDKSVLKAARLGVKRPG